MKRKTKIIRAKKKKIKKAIKRERNRAFNKSLKKTLLDSPAQSSSDLQVPLAPIKYTPPPPPPPLEEPPKIVPRLKPVKRIPKIISPKVKKMLDEITPYYNPETIREFKRKHEYVPVEFTITERSRALRGNVKSYEVPIFHSYDASLQLNNTKKQIIKLLMRLLKDKRGFKFNITLKVRLLKRSENGVIYRDLRTLL